MTQWLYSLCWLDKIIECKQISMLWPNYGNIYFLYRVHWTVDYIYCRNRLFHIHVNVLWPLNEVGGLTEGTLARKSDVLSLVTIEMANFSNPAHYNSFLLHHLDMVLMSASKDWLTIHYRLERKAGKDPGEIQSMSHRPRLLGRRKWMRYLE